LDANLVRVGGGEEKANGEGNRGCGGGLGVSLQRMRIYV